MWVGWLARTGFVYYYYTATTVPAVPGIYPRRILGIYPRRNARRADRLWLGVGRQTPSHISFEGTSCVVGWGTGALGYGIIIIIIIIHAHTTLQATDSISVWLTRCGEHGVGGLGR
ncbi:hypothetical protein B0T26DRAFT_383481 [Lasiosphaeria miniovina]|uniref:Uncharacterized protein n=1 Tax=Lasiosphaeria miniovina TaxID=1954250 RepID=A0AA40DSM5_9PEZI|nr:uncharacterized protein B0T26DRAFT_383481 [Lasiosphaeria miniovina]KAK0714020.1 hypothetical protein B0T26DRAFT_383481 [Lasiosphaeria miniovina]